MLRRRLGRLVLVLFALMLLGVTACVTSVEPREVATGALADPTAELGTRHGQAVSQDPEQRHIGLRLYLVLI